MRGGGWSQQQPPLGLPCHCQPVTDLCQCIYHRDKYVIYHHRSHCTAHIQRRRWNISNECWVGWRCLEVAGGGWRWEYSVICPFITEQNTAWLGHCCQWRAGWEPPPPPRDLLAWFMIIISVICVKSYIDCTVTPLQDWTVKAGALSLARRGERGGNQSVQAVQTE